MRLSQSFAALCLLLAAAPAGAQQVTGTPGAPDATTTIDGRYLPPPPQPFTGQIELNAAQSTPAWPARVVPPKGAPNMLLDHDRRRGLCRPVNLRRRDPDAGAGPHRRRRAALHQFPLDGAVLADAGRADHRPQPSLGRLRRHLRAVNRLSRLQQRSSRRTAPRSAASCRRTATARRGSARTTTRRPTRRARPGRSTSGRPAWVSSISTASSAATPASGSRTCSATRRRSIPMSGNPAGI